MKYRHCEKWKVAVLLFVIPLINSCLPETNDKAGYTSNNQIKYKTAKQEAQEEELTFENLVDIVYERVSSGPDPVKIDLQQIKERGKLVALTGYGLNSYFIYKGTPMGYEYELLEMLSRELGVKLEIVVVEDTHDIYQKLNTGQGDIIADNLIVTKESERVADFTIPHNHSRQVLIQKKPSNWRSLDPATLDKKLIRNTLDLTGKEVHVRKESAYFARMENLSEEIGSDIKIVTVSGDTATEDLIRLVAEGKIPYTIADENVALVNQTYYPDVDVSTPVSFPQRIAWAVRESSPDLLEAVNKWISRIRKEPVYLAIYNKYYRNYKILEPNIACRRQMTCGKNLSQYDNLIVQHAKEIGWDWRLLAALIYQESHFDPSAKSWAGATGLMQLMPMTAQHFGVTDPNNPVENLRGGTKYLKWLDAYWKEQIPDKDERLKFVMASYNVGQEHVADAVRLAAKYNRNPKVWDDNVAYFILQKSNPKFSTDPVVKYGYCRGAEPFNYVVQILERYEHYKKLIRESV